MHGIRMHLIITRHRHPGNRLKAELHTQSTVFSNLDGFTRDYSRLASAFRLSAKTWSCSDPP